MELFVVVIILAILASIVVGVVPAAAGRAKKSAFATTLSVARVRGKLQRALLNGG